jgi:ABC-type arginine transport system permease subunit
MPNLAVVHPWKWPERPWQRIHVDFAQKGKHQLFIVTDAYSHWPEVKCMRNTSATATVETLRGMFSAYRVETLRGMFSAYRVETLRGMFSAYRVETLRGMFSAYRVETLWGMFSAYRVETLRGMFSAYRVIEECVSDNGPQLVSKEMETLFQLNGG